MLKAMRGMGKRCGWRDVGQRQRSVRTSSEILQGQWRGSDFVFSLGLLYVVSATKTLHPHEVSIASFEGHGDDFSGDYSE